MSKSKIEWTEKSWNPTTGCTKISLGCDNCYAEVLANRLKLMGVEKYENGFNVKLHKNEIQKPTKWKKSSILYTFCPHEMDRKEAMKALNGALIQK